MALESDSDEEAIAFTLNASIGAILTYSDSFYTKQPYHTCPFSGIDWVHNLMEGNPRRFRNVLGVNLDVFKKLLHALRKIGYSDSKYVQLEEQLAIFLWGCVSGVSTEQLGERFQRSKDTISKYVLAFFLLHVLHT
jgi:hypothetical protein